MIGYDINRIGIKYDYVIGLLDGIIDRVMDMFFLPRRGLLWCVPRRDVLFSFCLRVLFQKTTYLFKRVIFNKKGSFLDQTLSLFIKATGSVVVRFSHGSLVFLFTCPGPNKIIFGQQV